MIKGLHHAGISVGNLDRSIRFYCDVLGMELVRRSNFGGAAMDRITKLSSTRGRSAMVRAGAQYLELFEFETPAPKSSYVSRSVCDHGLSHFCIEVANVQQEYERLTFAGVEFHCAPQLFGGAKATYGRDPDGNIFELLELPAHA